MEIKSPGHMGLFQVYENKRVLGGVRLQLCLVGRVDLRE